MTHGPADVLAVLLMAHWCNSAAGLSIVPLFETIHDLEAASQVMEELFGRFATMEQEEEALGPEASAGQPARMGKP